ncbi:MAG: hypothetical protein EHM35_00365 [Planctomycetaceae bacterium]|nr:MAG: hypothetical protein EHM35_00365 [Planctomycetaceae bacterium]
MPVQFTKATKEKSRLRMALIGPSGSGKTYTALRVGSVLKNGGRLAVIDTERGSASKYADLFDFDVLELDTFSPMTYVEAIKSAEGAGYDVLVIDSLSHAWMGKEGALEQVDKATARSQSRNSYTAWRDVTPMHNALIDAMIQSRCHIIATMRTKTDYVMEKDEHTGKTAVRKVGLAPVQRDGMEYEFDVTADMDPDNNFIVSKSRCPALHGQMINKPGEDLALILNTWLTTGAEPTPRPVRQATPEPPAATTPTNGGGSKPKATATPAPPRPLPAEKVRKAIRKNSGWIDIDTRRTDTEAVTPAQVTALLATMTQAVKPSQGVLSENEVTGRRHAVLEYLLGVTSTGSLTKAEASALLDWLTVPDDIKSLNEYAGRECAIVYATWQVEQGQGELPL